MKYSRKTLLKKLVEASIAPWYCEHCGQPVEDKQYTLCSKHYKKWIDTRDYQYLCSQQSSKSFRELLWIGDCWSNKIMCNKCGDKIRSTNGHDFHHCKCWAVAVDWGSWYGRRIWNPWDYLEMSKSFTHL